MPLLDSTLSLIAFKHLQGKSMTDTNKGVGNEAEGIKLNVDAGAIFVNEIDSDPSVAVLMGVAEFVTADLTLDPTSNNQAYFATYPIGHPLAGQRIKNAISPTYGDGYEAKPFAGVNPIPVNDPIDWVYQYQSGIFYFQDPGSLGGTPTTIDLYVYTGDLLSDIVGNISVAEPDWNTTTADDLQMIPTGNVLPNSNDANDLGSDLLRWKDLYLGSKIDASTILEFVTAGNTRIYIDASGNVGIGTEAPSAKVHINNTTSDYSFLVEDSTNPDGTPLAIDNEGRLFVGVNPVDWDGFAKAEIGGSYLRLRQLTNALSVADNGTYTGDWQYGAAGGKLTISKSGMGNALHLYSFGNSDSLPHGTYIPSTNVARIGGNSTWWNAIDQYTKAAIKSDNTSSSSFNLRTYNSSDQVLFVIRDDGNIGIGTETPTSRLHIKGAGNTTGTIGFLHESLDTNSFYRIYDDGTIWSRGIGSNQHLIESPGFMYLRLNSTNSSGTALSLQLGGTNSSELINQSGLTRFAQAANQSWGVYGSDNNPYILFDEANKRIGINTATPLYTLDSRGSFNLQAGTDIYIRLVSLAIRAQTNTSNYIVINRDNSGLLDLNASNSAQMTITSTNEAISISTTAATIRHNTNISFRRTDNYAFGYWDTTNYRLKVGSLGTSPSAPTDTLEVFGTFKLQDGNQGTDKVLVSNSTGVGTWKDISDLPTKCVGSFYDTTDQTVLAADTPYSMQYNTTDISAGVYVATDLSSVYVEKSGIYNIQFSAQLTRTSGTAATVDIWLAKNGTDVPNTNTSLTMGNNNEYLVAAWNFLLQMNAGDYFELKYSVSQDDIYIAHEIANVSVPHPATPSVILTVTQM